MSTLTAVRTNSALYKLWHNLSNAANHGSLTAETLSEAIDTINAVNPLVLESVGLAWLSYWLKLDGGNAARISAQLDIPAIYQAHMHNPHIVEVLSCPRLFSLVDECERTQFAQSILDEQLPQGTAWIQYVREVGVSRQFVAHTILKWLRQPSPNRVHLVDAVLEGAGMSVYRACRQNVREHLHLVDANAVWGYFNDQELIEALRICATIAPARFLNAWRPNGLPALLDLIEARLHTRPDGREIVSDILYIAAVHVKDRHASAVDQLMRLTPRHKLQLLREHNGYSLPFLVEVASRLSHGYQLFDEFVAELCVTTPELHLVFCAIQSQLAQMADRSLAAHIDEVLVTNLAQRGFRVGHLTNGWEFQTVVDGVTYVQSHKDSTLLAYGDRVVFDARSGRQRGSNKRSVRFYLVSAANDDV